MWQSTDQAIPSKSLNPTPSIGLSPGAKAGIAVDIIVLFALFILGT